MIVAVYRLHTCSKMLVLAVWISISVLTASGQAPLTATGKAIHNLLYLIL